LKRHRQLILHQQRLSKPHSIDTLAEINSYRPKAQNIYNRPDAVINKPHPHITMMQISQNRNAQGGATGGAAIGGTMRADVPGGDAYHNNDSYNASHDSMQLVHLGNQANPHHTYETLNRHGGMIPPPFILQGMPQRPFSEVYHTQEPNEIARTWLSHNAVYYNDMGEETPLYQEI